MKLGLQVHFIDLGVPGILIHQALQVEVPVAIDAHPNIVTVWLGVNDILQKVPVSSYTQDLDLLLSRLQAAAPSVPAALAASLASPAVQRSACPPVSPEPRDGAYGRAPEP